MALNGEGVTIKGRDWPVHSSGRNSLDVRGPIGSGIHDVDHVSDFNVEQSDDVRLTLGN